MSRSLSIVIPLYRDVDALEPIFERCRPVLDAAGPGSELVLVDDFADADGTSRRAAELAAGYPHRVCVVTLARNFGQHPAVFAGLAQSTGDLVVTLDSDLQYPPEEIAKLLAAVTPETPVASGYRENRRDPATRRLITGTLTRWLNRRTGAQLRDFGSMFRAYDRRTVDLMLTFTERHRYLPAVVAWLGVPITEVPIEHHERGTAGSRYRFGALVDMTLDLVTGYSVAPLRLVTGVGILASMLGFLVSAAFLVYRVAVGEGVSQTVTAFALVFALLSVQLLLTALLSEFVGRLYTEAKGRPYYLVREVQYAGAANKHPA